MNLLLARQGGAPSGGGGGDAAVAYQMILNDIGTQSVEGGWKLANTKGVFHDLVDALSEGAVSISSSTVLAAFNSASDASAIRGNAAVYSRVRASAYMQAKAAASSEMSFWQTLVIDNIQQEAGSLDVTAQDSNTLGFTVTADGQYVIVCGGLNDKFFGYTLDPAGDVTQAVLDDSVSMPVLNTTYIALSADETKMYGVSGSSVHQFNFGTPRTMTSLTDPGVSISYASPIRGMDVSSDGRFIITTHQDGFIRRREMSTPGELSTAGAVDQSFDLGTQWYGLSLAKNGLRFFATTEAATIGSFDLAGQWDVSDVEAGLTRALTGTQNRQVCAVESLGAIFAIDDSQERVTRYTVEKELL